MLVEAAQASWAKGMALIADALFRARRGVMYISADRLSFVSGYVAPQSPVEGKSISGCG